MGDTKQSRVEKARKDRRRQFRREIDEFLDRRDEPHPDNFTSDEELDSDIFE